MKIIELNNNVNQWCITSGPLATSGPWRVLM